MDLLHGLATNGFPLSLATTHGLGTPALGTNGSLTGSSACSMVPISGSNHTPPRSSPSSSQLAFSGTNPNIISIGHSSSSSSSSSSSASSSSGSSASGSLLASQMLLYPTTPANSGGFPPQAGLVTPPQPQQQTAMAPPDNSNLHQTSHMHQTPQPNHFSAGLMASRLPCFFSSGENLAQLQAHSNSVTGSDRGQGFTDSLLSTMTAASGVGLGPCPSFFPSLLAETCYPGFGLNGSLIPSSSTGQVQNSAASPSSSCSSPFGPSSLFAPFSAANYGEFEQAEMLTMLAKMSANLRAAAVAATSPSAPEPSFTITSAGSLNTQAGSSLLAPGATGLPITGGCFRSGHMGPGNAGSEPFPSGGPPLASVPLVNSQSNWSLRAGVLACELSERAMLPPSNIVDSAERVPGQSGLMSTLSVTSGAGESGSNSRNLLLCPGLGSSSDGDEDSEVDGDAVEGDPEGFTGAEISRSHAEALLSHMTCRGEGDEGDCDEDEDDNDDEVHAKSISGRDSRGTRVREQQNDTVDSHVAPAGPGSLGHAKRMSGVCASSAERRAACGSPVSPGGLNCLGSGFARGQSGASGGELAVGLGSVASYLDQSKRYRTSYTHHQTKVLEASFRHERYISRPQRAQLAVELGLPENTIKVWFQNRRMKEKRQSLMLPNIAGNDPHLRETLLRVAQLYYSTRYPVQTAEAMTGTLGSNSCFSPGLVSAESTPASATAEASPALAALTAALTGLSGGSGCLGQTSQNPGPSNTRITSAPASFQVLQTPLNSAALTPPLASLLVQPASPVSPRPQSQQAQSHSHHQHQHQLHYQHQSITQQFQGLQRSDEESDQSQLSAYILHASTTSPIGPMAKSSDDKDQSANASDEKGVGRCDEDEEDEESESESNKLEPAVKEKDKFSVHKKKSQQQKMMRTVRRKLHLHETVAKGAGGRRGSSICATATSKSCNSPPLDPSNQVAPQFTASSPGLFSLAPQAPEPTSRLASSPLPGSLLPFGHREASGLLGGSPLLTGFGGLKCGHRNRHDEPAPASGLADPGPIGGFTLSGANCILPPLPPLPPPLPPSGLDPAPWTGCLSLGHSAHAPQVNVGYPHDAGAQTAWPALEAMSSRSLEVDKLRLGTPSPLPGQASCTKPTSSLAMRASEWFDQLPRSATSLLKPLQHLPFTIPLIPSGASSYQSPPLPPPPPPPPLPPPPPPPPPPPFSQPHQFADMATISPQSPSSPGLTRRYQQLYHLVQQNMLAAAAAAVAATAATMTKAPQSEEDTSTSTHQPSWAYEEIEPGKMLNDEDESLGVSLLRKRRCRPAEESVSRTDHKRRDIKWPWQQDETTKVVEEEEDNKTKPEKEIVDEAECEREELNAVGENVCARSGDELAVCYKADQPRQLEEPLPTMTASATTYTNTTSAGDNTFSSQATSTSPPSPMSGSQQMASPNRSGGTPGRGSGDGARKSNSMEMDDIDVSQTAEEIASRAELRTYQPGPDGTPPLSSTDISTTTHYAKRHLRLPSGGARQTGALETSISQEDSMTNNSNYSMMKTSRVSNTTSTLCDLIGVPVHAKGHKSPSESGSPTRDDLAVSPGQHGYKHSFSSCDVQSNSSSASSPSSCTSSSLQPVRLQHKHKQHQLPSEHDKSTNQKSLPLPPSEPSNRWPLACSGEERWIFSHDTASNNSTSTPRQTKLFRPFTIETVVKADQ